ncbi:hypothetical protein BKA70DRAFT_1402942 [Coprinopsis sp. MPI-PUGE-AT-0042]|nr:hypothetical protein BKA70DRAFT_1402942 [Coprinopsis sp. MPI-PUGE-AT-0042]
MPFLQEALLTTKTRRREGISTLVHSPPANPRGHPNRNQPSSNPLKLCRRCTTDRCLTIYIYTAFSTKDERRRFEVDGQQRPTLEWRGWDSVASVSGTAVGRRGSVSDSLPFLISEHVLEDLDHDGHMATGMLVVKMKREDDGCPLKLFQGTMSAISVKMLISTTTLEVTSCLEMLKEGKGVDMGAISITTTQWSERGSHYHQGQGKDPHKGE